MSETIDISKLDKAEVLAALYNSSRQQGAGFFHARGKSDMTVEEAREELSMGDDHAKNFPDRMKAGRELYFDYLHGRVMKVDLSRDNLDPRLYDRDNGPGAAAIALSGLLAKAELESEQKE